MAKDDKKEKEIELRKGSLCRFVIIGPGDDTLDLEGTFKGYIDFMGQGMGIAIDVTDVDGKTTKKPIHRIIPFSSIIFMDIIKEGKSDDKDKDKNKVPSNMFN